MSETMKTKTSKPAEFPPAFSAWKPTASNPRMVDDYMQFIKCIRDVYPIELPRQAAVYAAIVPPRQLKTAVDLFFAVAKIVSAFEDAHFSLVTDPTIADVWAPDIYCDYLPECGVPAGTGRGGALEIVGGRLAGKRVTSINGGPVDKFLDAAATSWGYTPGAFADRCAVAKYTFFYNESMNHAPPVKFVADGKEYNPTKMRALDWDKFDKFMVRRVQNQATFRITGDELHVKIGTFWLDHQNVSAYNRMLKAIVKAKTVIVDLRGNGGGDIFNASKLCLALFGEGIGRYRRYEKLSPIGVDKAWEEVEAGRLEPQEAAMAEAALQAGKKYMMVTIIADSRGKKPASLLPKSVTILIDEGSWSASLFVCDVAKKHGAKIVGRGGHSDVTSAGPAIKLTNSGISVTIPFCYIQYPARDRAHNETVC
jgi:hypothetical protein